MKKIKLYDYQQEMLENIIKMLTANATGRFYNEKGKKERIGSSVMVQMQQTLDRFCLEYGKKEMVLKAKVRIRVLSIQWLNRHLDELERAESMPGLIVVDEAHHAIDIVHAQAIAACYNALGLKSVALDSKTPAKKRMEMVEAFRRSEIDCLVNVNLFDEGFDCPDVEFIQMARPTLSLAKYMQMVGRGLRINKEEDDRQATEGILEECEAI